LERKREKVFAFAVAILVMIFAPYIYYSFCMYF